VVCQKLRSHIAQGVNEPIKGRTMNLQNRATRTIGSEGSEGEASRDSGKGKEDSDPEEEHSSSPKIRTQTVLPVKEMPHFEGMKREDAITFIW